MERFGRVAATIALLAGAALADPVPFNEGTLDWFELPAAAVDLSNPISGGFATARLNESSQATYIIFENDPAFGDTVLFQYNGEVGATIEFDWEFTKRGDDTLYVNLIDPSQSDLVQGTNGYIPAPYALVAAASGSGHVSWELSALGFTGPFGISFEFFSEDPFTLAPTHPDRTGSAVISNLEFNIPGSGSDPVPEPSTIVLLAAAGMGYAWLRKRRVRA